MTKLEFKSGKTESSAQQSHEDGTIEPSSNDTTNEVSHKFLTIFTSPGRSKAK